MKFDVVIGNPPYQMDDGGGMTSGSSSGSSIPLYDKFVEAAKRLKPEYIIMIIPAKWYSGGRGLDKFRQDMLTDRHVKVLVDIEDSRECFNGVSIAGGVCYFLWDKSYASIYTNVISVSGSLKEESIRILDEFEFFIRDSKTADIIRKVQMDAENVLSEYVEGSRPFGIRSFEKGVKNFEEGLITLVGSTGVSYIEESQVKNNKDLISFYKVIVSKAANERAGQLYKIEKRKVLSKVSILGPDVVCTESYLVLSTFKTLEEANNFKTYVESCFFRFLLSAVLLTQNISKDKFCFVPIQDFSEAWTDEKLYKKYSFSKDEVDYIKSKIRDM